MSVRVRPPLQEIKMNAELAVVDILQDDSNYSAIVGDRVFYDEADQGEVLPFSIVRAEDIQPSDDKDGPSTMDHDFIYVTHFAGDTETAAAKETVANMASKARTALDRTSGTYNGIVVQSIQFLTQRSGTELLVDKKTLTIEQQYKIITTQ